MIHIINLRSKEALDDLTQFKNKQYVMCDVRFENIHLRKINELIRFNLFEKNDLFANSDTLWSLMQADIKSDSHNHHGLTPEDILDALNNIIRPYCIFKSKQDRISIVLSCLSHYGEPLMAIIEIGSSLIINKDANINKLVTMYPYGEIDKVINKLDSKEILYINKLSN